MFRIFLTKKLASGSSRKSKPFVPRTSYHRNRRLVERYNVDQKHLTLLNEQDILVVRELSPMGFSSDVSDRGFQRFVIDDSYEGRIAYRGKTFPLQMRVSWKKDHVVGFEVTLLTKSTEAFIATILEPMAIGRSLKQVESRAMQSGVKITFEGQQSSHLSLWLAGDDSVTSWRLHWEDSYVEYDQRSGLKTGRLTRLSKSAAPDEIDHFVDDVEVDSELSRFAFDILVGLESAYKQSLLVTFEDTQTNSTNL